MNMRAMVLALLLGLPLFVASVFAAEHGSLADIAKLGDRTALQSALNGLPKGDIAGPQGADALIVAASRNDVAMADLLLQAGADPKGSNEYGATALYAAAGNVNPSMAARLLAAGADANARLLSGETPLIEATRRGNVETMHALLAAGADPNAQEVNGGQTALMWAISERHPAAVEELVQSKADVHVRSKKGSTALMFAAQQTDAEYTHILLGAGANANDIMPRTSLTPLIIASAMGHGAVAALLLDK